MARGHHFRANGGRTLEYTKESNVMDEAKERKNGGKAMKHVMMDGAMTKHRRLDRPGRKRGGSVGATHHPLSSAAHVTQAGAHKAENDEMPD